MEPLEKIGKNIKHFRKEKKISQVELSTSCDITQTYLSQIEHGLKNVSINVLISIAKALSIPLQFLFINHS